MCGLFFYKAGEWLVPRVQIIVRYERHDRYGKAGRGGNESFGDPTRTPEVGQGPLPT